MPSDMLNKPLVIGDYVFVTRKSYRDIVLARVTGFTPKQVRVVYMSNSTYPEAYLTTEVILVSAQDLDNIPLKKQRADLAFEQKERAL